MAALLPLLLLLSMEAAAQEQLDCAAGPIENPVPPESLVEHRVTMAYAEPAERTAAFTAEDMATVRKARHEMRTLFDPRPSIDASGSPIELSARFCGLDYPECAAAAWKPAGLECADVVPRDNQNCTNDEMQEYAVAIGLPSVFWIAFGVTFMVLNALWYLLRCCKLFGGMRAGKGCCCMKCAAPGSRLTAVGAPLSFIRRATAATASAASPTPAVAVPQVLQREEGPGGRHRQWRTTELHARPAVQGPAWRLPCVVWVNVLAHLHVRRYRPVPQLCRHAQLCLDA